MAIRNVNGRNVYVLEPSRASGTKTTTGKNWATLYTDLRWQVWEATQKNEAAKLKLELASADQRRDYYDDKIKVLQDQRKQLQAAALKAQGGSTNSANSDVLRAAGGLERMSRQQAGQVVTTTKPAKDIMGDIIPGKFEVSTKETAPVGGLDARASAVYGRIVDQYMAGGMDEAEASEAAAAEVAGPSLDSQIESLDKELESLLTQRRGAGTGVDFDLQARTRRAFEADQGVIGKGGTAFGLAPRRRRTMSRVDQPLAQERVGAFAEAAVQEKAQRQALQEKRMDLLLRKEEAMMIEGDMSGALVMSIDEEIGAIDSALAQPSLVESALQSPEFTPRRAGELLLKDVPSRREPRRVPAAMVSTGDMEVEEVPASPVEPSGGMGELGLDTKSPEEIQAAREAVEALGGGIGEKTEGVLPDAPVPDPRAPIVDRSLQAQPVPAGQRRLPGEGLVGPAPEETPLPAGQPLVLGKDDAIKNPNILDNPGFVPSQDLLAEAQKYFKGMTIQGQGDKRPRKILSPQRHFGGETEMVKEYLKEQIKQDTPVGGELDQEKIEAVEEPQAKTTRQRKDLYKMRVVTEGAKLARTPKKLSRLAKTNLETEDRPEHFVIVDKLMATNSGKSNAFDMSYNEISRAYKDKPDQRKEAHSYLVAKDILEGDINEPMA